MVNAPLRPPVGLTRGGIIDKGATSETYTTVDYLMQCSKSGADDWYNYGTQRWDCQESARKALAAERERRSESEYDLRLVRVTITEETLEG
jgi:hypothetical protein